MVFMFNCFILLSNIFDIQISKKNVDSERIEFEAGLSQKAIRQDNIRAPFAWDESL